MRVAPRETAAVTRASARWVPPYQYHCDRNHEIHADRPITKCPAVVRGEPCPGSLKRFGPGSKET
jgi:hypothetical protein